MGDRDSLQTQVEMLKDSVLKLERMVREKAWQLAQVSARMALSDASKVHSRITAINDAMAELSGD